MDGKTLEYVLGQARGQQVYGQPMTASKNAGIIGMTDSTQTPMRLLVEGPVYPGGFAAVARCKVVGTPSYGYLRPAATPNPPAGATVALRVEPFNGNNADKRRAAVTLAGVLSRTEPQRYPALIKVHQTFRTRLGGLNVICDVAEWCTTLDTHMLQHTTGIPEDQAIALWIPLAETMSRLYEDHNWVHRDIDELNILVSDDGTLKITDLGIVSTLPTLATHLSTVVAGKNLNFPPEGRAAWNEGKTLAVRPSYDAWQLGRILSILLTGNRRAVLDQPTGATRGLARQQTIWGTATNPRTIRTLNGLLDPNPTTRWTLTQAVETLRPPTEPVQIALRAHQDEIERLRQTPAARNSTVRTRQLDYIEKVLKAESQPMEKDHWRYDYYNKYHKDESLPITTRNLEAWRKNASKGLADISAIGWVALAATLPLLATVCITIGGSLGVGVAWIATAADGQKSWTAGLLFLASLAGAWCALMLYAYWADLWDRGALKMWGSADITGTGYGGLREFSFERLFYSPEFRRTASWWAAWLPPTMIIPTALIAGYWLGRYVIDAVGLVTAMDQTLSRVF